MLIGPRGNWQGYLGGNAYHLMNMAAPNEANFFITTVNGKKIIQTGQCSVIQPIVLNSLAVKEYSDSVVELFINRSRVDRVNSPGIGFRGGRIGLIAVSTGIFDFDL